jgi:hypothetical protein
MKWFKHDSNACADAKLQRIRMKYGMEGYGLYWYCLELIADNVDENNLTFELEHDAELIAHSTGIHYERVEEMMRYMVDLGLFESEQGRITCLKMAHRLDQSMTSSPRMRDMIKKIRKNHDSVMINHDSVMQEETRLEENRKEKKRESKPKRAQGTRLRSDFSLPDEWAEFARTKRPDINPQLTFEEFKDYWIAQPGQKGVKLDWLATWRNWVRREKAVVSHKKTDDNARPDVWGVNVTELMTMATRHGITPRPGEGWDDLRRRVNEKIRD